MPHVSKNKLTENAQRELEEKIIAFLVETGARTRRRVFRELFTKTERLMIAKRLTMLLLIDKKISPYNISTSLHVSPSTVARFENAAEKGAFRETISWLRKYRLYSRVVRLLVDFGAIPFEARRKSFAQMIDDI